MPFKYSSFISYRRETERNKFVENFCRHLRSRAFDACNSETIFLDNENILPGDDFPERIYEAIRNSYYFTLFHNYHYLHTENLWCAKELKYALDVEVARRSVLNEEDKDQYNWIFPLIVRGNLSDLPPVIGNRHGIHIGKFESAINSQRPLPQKISDFFDDIYDKLISLYKIYEKYPSGYFDNCTNEIVYATDEEIVEWIKIQKEAANVSETVNKPILIKNEEG